MENKLITVSGVTGYIDENGTAQLNLDNVARGLGFTQIAASGNEAVRWERVNKYLEEFGFIPTSGDGGFIPENIFYRLAMKASNKTAIDFQCKIADEILPAIRKTGTYISKKQDPELEKLRRADAMLLNAKTRQANLMRLMAKEFKDILSPESVQLLIAGASEIVAGKPLLSKPSIEIHFTATEIGEEIGVSANKIGRVSNKNNLKASEYGMWVLDKSASSDKQVKTFVYNERGRQKLFSLLDQENPNKEGV